MPDKRLETDLDALEVIKSRLQYPDRIHIVLEVSFEIDIHIFSRLHDENDLLEYLTTGEVPVVDVKSVNPV